MKEYLIEGFPACLTQKSSPGLQIISIISRICKHALISCAYGQAHAYACMTFESNLNLNEDLYSLS